MKVIALAAGFGTRLYPLTEHHAKPLLDIAGRTVLDRLLDRTLEIDGITELIVIVNGRFAADFEAWAERSRHDVATRIVNDGAPDNDSRLGAIADIALAIDEGGIVDDDEVIVAGGDNLFDFPLTGAAERFRGSGRPLVLVREIPGEVPPGRYSEVTLDEAGDIASFREKPADPRSNLSSICYYFFPPGLRSRIADYLADGGNPDAPGHFLSWLARRETLAAAKLTGRWFDIGNMESLNAARAAFGEDAPPDRSSCS